MKKLNKKQKLTIFISIFLAILAIFALFYTQKGKNDAIIATANGQNIYQQEIDKKLQQVLAATGQNLQFKDLPKEARMAFLQDIFLERQLDQMAQNANLNQAEIDKEVAEYRRSAIRQAYLDNLVEQKVNEAAIKAEYEKLKKEINGKQEVHLSHIVVADFNKAAALTQKIKKKSSKNDFFAKMAQENSIDSSNAKNGGDLDYLLLENLDENFAAVVQKLKIGQISDPIQTGFGWHIVLLHDKRTAQIPDFAESRETIAENLRQKTIEDLFEKITQNAQIKISSEAKAQKSGK
jgi:peptidyl-prolyl cis-trans isomerase C